MCLAICVTPALQFEHLCLFGEAVCAAHCSLSGSQSITGVRLEFEARDLHFLCFPHVTKVALPVSGAGKHGCNTKQTHAQTHIQMPTYCSCPGIHVFWQ